MARPSSCFQQQATEVDRLVNAGPLPTRSYGSSPRIAARVPGWSDLAKRDDTDQIAAYLAAAPNWGAEMSALRALALGCGLDEAIKWRKPCFIRKGADMTSTQARCAGC